MIIHGKGEGILRKQTLEFLKENPNVRSFRAGGHSEGGTGVTIVDLY
jgi:DNA mismatch repair protein MutS2